MCSPRNVRTGIHCLEQEQISYDVEHILCVLTIGPTKAPLAPLNGGGEDCE